MPVCRQKREAPRKLALSLLTFLHLPKGGAREKSKYVHACICLNTQGLYNHPRPWPPWGMKSSRHREGGCQAGFTVLRHAVNM